MRAILDTCGAVYELLRLGCITRFNLRGAYWSWRLNTAFGRERPGRGEMLRGVLAYARWVHRLRRGL